MTQKIQKRWNPYNKETCKRNYLRRWTYKSFRPFLNGFSEIPVYWEDEELDWEEYKICLKWCKREKIRTIADLRNRVMSQKDYERLWCKRCEKMQRNLEQRRKRKSVKEKPKTI